MTCVAASSCSLALGLFSCLAAETPLLFTEPRHPAHLVTCANFFINAMISFVFRDSTSVQRAIDGQAGVEEKAWGNYLRGALWVLAKRFGSGTMNQGVVAVVNGLPGADCAGISSSAAVSDPQAGFTINNQQKVYNKYNMSPQGRAPGSLA